VRLRCSLPIVHCLGGKMSTVSTVATSVRIAAAASAIAAATLVPGAVAYASPITSLSEATIGSTLTEDTVAECDPALSTCTTLAAAEVGAASSSSSLIQNSLIWFGAANPDFQPLIGIAFPSFGLDFEACFLGFAIHLSPYGTGFIGLGLGC
jgi:hypothetical protein